MSLTMLSLFSGIGAFEEGFKRVRDIEVLGFSENDDYAGKVATKVYKFFHGSQNEIGKVQNVKGIDFYDVDILTHGSPCQSFSIINRVDEIKGGEKGSGTKSSLMWETVRIVEESKPKVIVWENVKSVLNNRNKATFKQYLYDLELKGYNNYYEVLNGTDFGIPQNRERIFVVSIRKDIDPGNFSITKKRIKADTMHSILDSKVDLSTIVSKEQLKAWKNKKGDFGNRLKLTNPIRDYANTLTTKPGVGAVTNDFFMTEYSYYDKDLYKLKGRELASEMLKRGTEVRYLSISERFRLMGFDASKLKQKNFLGISYSQLGRMTGNSIITTIPESIMKDLTKYKIL